MIIVITLKFLNAMKSTRKYLILLLFLPLVSKADVNRVFITGIDLLDYCQQSSNFCFGYVTAVVDDTSMIYGEGASFCLPADINAEQLQQVVIEYMENRPQQLHLPGPDIVNLALTTAYSCP